MGNGELIVIVNENNSEIGTTTRAEMRRRNLIHRASYILVFNFSGAIFVQKRTKTKDIYPKYYDIAAGGVVQANETYEESARRELQEELGITSGLIFLFDHYYADENNKVWGRAFSCVHEGPFLLQEDEVESGEFMDIHDILSVDNNKQFTPDGIEILKKLVNIKSLETY
jgi:8-oxo-dGTP pyrophosphatase MutT (NUDIX family)